MSASGENMASGSERRRSPRYPVSLPVRFWSERLDPGRVELSGEVSDVSWGGLFVRCELLEKPGTPVSLLVSLPDDEPVPLNGQVAWVTEQPPKGRGMGISLL